MKRPLDQLGNTFKVVKGRIHLQEGDAERSAEQNERVQQRTQNEHLISTQEFFNNKDSFIPLKIKTSKLSKIRAR